MNCNEIFVLERGRIREKGKFYQLQRYKNLKMDEDSEEYNGPGKHLYKANEGIVAIGKAEAAEDKEEK